MAFEKVKKAFVNETGIEKVMRGLDMLLDGTEDMCEEYERMKYGIKATHPNFGVYCREQAEVALAVSEAFSLYEGITGTVAATQEIDDDFEILRRRAVATAEKWERELAKFEQRPFDGMDEDSRFAIKPSRELKFYGIEQ